MQKFEGIHFYVNVANFNEVVIDEEMKSDKVHHAIHALDTFFKSIESFGKKNFPEKFVVEKITGARLHMYVVDDIDKAYDIVEEVVEFTGNLAKYLNNNIAKYKTLQGFKVQVGACFGRFCNFKFKRKNADEETTIGYAANYAAKLQGLCNAGNIAISSNIFDGFSVDKKKKYVRCTSPKIQKYGEKCYYETSVSNLNGKIDYTESLRESKEYANEVNLTEMVFRKPTKMVAFDNLSKKECKEIEGIPLFADVRGFTSQFDNDDTNLDEMVVKTQKILTTMYNQVEENKGIHVQFQGDREFALFHNYAEYECHLDAVKTGLKMIDAVQNYGVSIGVGESFGKMFATRIGARDEKDYLLIGTTVIEADRNEDENAQANQLVISEDIYLRLKEQKPKWAKIFKKQDGYYYTTTGYNNLINLIAQEQLRNNNRKNNYNGAWRG